jgi:hypothetical protein
MNMDDVGLKSWLEAKKVIRQFIRDIKPDQSRSLEQEDAWAVALIARLAGAELLIYSCTELDEKYVERRSHEFAAMVDGHERRSEEGR